MALHDYVRCLMPLPPGAPAWATTSCIDGRARTMFSASPTLETYTIHQDGRVTRKRGFYEPVPESQKPKRNKNDWNPLSSMRHDLRWVETRDIESDYTGPMEFWTTRMVTNDEGDIVPEFIDLRARIVDGRCVALDLVGGGDTASTSAEDQTPNDDSPTTQQDAGSTPAASNE